MWCFIGEQMLVNIDEEVSKTFEDKKVEIISKLFSRISSEYLNQRIILIILASLFSFTKFTFLFMQIMNIGNGIKN